MINKKNKKTNKKKQKNKLDRVTRTPQITGSIILDLSGERRWSQYTVCKPNTLN